MYINNLEGFDNIVSVTENPYTNRYGASWNYSQLGIEKSTGRNGGDCAILEEGKRHNWWLSTGASIPQPYHNYSCIGFAFRFNETPVNPALNAVGNSFNDQPLRTFFKMNKHIIYLDDIITGTSSNPRFLISVFTNTSPSFDLVDGTDFTINYEVLGNVPQDTNWHYFEIGRDFDRNRVEISLDGVLVFSGNETSTYPYYEEGNGPFGGGDTLYNCFSGSTSNFKMCFDDYYSISYQDSEISTASQGFLGTKVQVLNSTTVSDGIINNINKTNNSIPFNQHLAPDLLGVNGNYLFANLPLEINESRNYNQLYKFNSNIPEPGLGILGGQISWNSEVSSDEARLDPQIRTGWGDYHGLEMSGCWSRDGESTINNLGDFSASSDGIPPDFVIGQNMWNPMFTYTNIETGVPIRHFDYNNINIGMRTSARRYRNSD